MEAEALPKTKIQSWIKHTVRRWRQFYQELRKIDETQSS
jgi:hypothetical protein